MGTDNPDQWTLLADTTAQLSPDKSSAIVPAADFTSVELQPQQTYSLYLHFSSTNVFKYRSADSLIGETFDSNELLDVKVGVTLKDPNPFPKTFDLSSNFNGVVHYRTSQSCTSVLTTSTVDLEFAINDDSTADNMAALEEAVKAAVSSVFTLDPKLIQYTKNHMLELTSVNANFQGRSKEKCPTKFDKCSLVFTTLQLTHLQTVQESELRTVILKYDETIRGSVVGLMDLDTEYVGFPIQKAEYLFTLKGVPSGQTMNAIQKRYFERIATDFYGQFSEEVAIYRVEVTDECCEMGINHYHNNDEI